MSMQQDAIRRVREMQRIANNKLNGVEPNKKQHSEPPPPDQFHARNQPNISGQQSNRRPEIPPVMHSDLPGRQTDKTERQEKIKESDQKNAQSGGNFIEGILSQLNLDQDRLIVLLLLIVLMREGTDGKLLLALCYLLL